ncbi:MAG: FliH/SctL family protein [Firmicutes bacterium]|nr:FliH/SctL family protein [Bacillota bacterium]
MSKIYRDMSGVLQTRVVSPPVMEMMTAPQAIPLDPLAQADGELEQTRALIEAEQARLTALTQEAQDLMTAASARAEQLIQDALDETLRQREHALVQGHKQGYAQGLEEGRSKYESLIVQAQAVLGDAERERRTRILETESFVADLGLVVARRLVLREVERDDVFLLSLTREVLTEVDKAHRVELRVAPGDFSHMLSQRSAIEKMFYQRVECLIVPDHALRTGDLVVVTEMGTVDARLDVRLEGVKKALQAVAKEWEQRESLAGETASLS